jgi:hypothetical protein
MAFGSLAKLATVCARESVWRLSSASIWMGPWENGVFHAGFVDFLPRCLPAEEDGSRTNDVPGKRRSPGELNPQSYLYNILHDYERRCKREFRVLRYLR